MNIENLWWGYLHTNGNVQAKRYFEPLDIQEAHESSFVQRTTGPFPASGREEALNIVAKRLTPKSPGG